jgi:hypothetical protein
VVSPEIVLGVLLAGFAGGALGAAIGAQSALGVAGLGIVVGELVAVLSGAGPESALGIELAVVDASGLSAAGFGPLFGPHVAFAGGAAAAAYAGRKTTIDTGFRYHQAKGIAAPLWTRPRSLVVGGAFGAFGVAVARLAGALPLPFDPVAFAVVVSALAHRLVFGYPLLGRLRGLGRPVLDMSPFEAGEYWGDGGNPTEQGIGGRHVVEPWQPEFGDWQTVAALGAGVGLGAGALALASGSPFLAFGLALASLLAVPAGTYDVPVTHHIALPAGIAALAAGSGPVAGLALAVAFGTLGGVLGELSGRLCYAHADTHLDPGFLSILATSLVLGGLAVTGVVDPGAVPYPAV